MWKGFFNQVKEVVSVFLLQVEQQELVEVIIPFQLRDKVEYLGQTFFGVSVSPKVLERKLFRESLRLSFSTDFQ